MAYGIHRPITIMHAYSSMYKHLHTYIYRTEQAYYSLKEQTKPSYHPCTINHLSNAPCTCPCFGYQIAPENR